MSRMQSLSRKKRNCRVNASPLLHSSQVKELPLLRVSRMKKSRILRGRTLNCKPKSIREKRKLKSYRRNLIICPLEGKRLFHQLHRWELAYLLLLEEEAPLHPQVVVAHLPLLDVEVLAEVPQAVGVVVLALVALSQQSPRSTHLRR